MKNGSKRTISRIVAFVMLVSCMFSNIVSADATKGILEDAVETVVSDALDSGAGALTPSGTYPQTEGVPFQSSESKDIKYPLDQAYTGKVTVNIDFNTNEITKNGNFILLRSAAGKDYDAGIRIIEGIAYVTRTDGDVSCPAGNLIAGDNKLSLSIDTNTGDITCDLNGTKTTRVNDNASYPLSDVKEIKVPKKTGRITTINAITVVVDNGDAPVIEDTTEATTAAPITEATTVATTVATTEGTTEVTTEVALWGDVDSDGDVDIVDVDKTLQYTLRPESVTGFNAAAADVSGNSTVNSEDVALILQKVLDGSFKFPVEGGSSDAPQPGKTYTADFKVLTVNDKLNGYKSADGTIGVVSAADTAYVHDADHGAALANGDQITVAVAGDADIEFGLCQYGHGTEFTVTDADGNVLGTVKAKGEATDTETATFSYKGAATTLTFTLAAAGEAYLHGVTSKNLAAPIGKAENFTLWLDDIAVDAPGADGTPVKTVEPGEIKYADSTLTLIGNGDTKFTPEIVAGQNVDFGNGNVHNAYKAGPRHATANDIPTVPVAGDGTAVVFTPAATGTFVTYFYSSSFVRVWDFDNEGTRIGYTDSAVSPGSHAFKAESGHTYVLSTTGKTNNCAYAGFEYIVDEPVTIGVSLNNVNANASSLPSLEIYLTDVNLGTVEATVKADTTSVDLAKGHTYKLTTNDGGVKATVAEAETFKAGDAAIVIDLYDIPDETLTGEITGTPEGTVSKVTFTNMINGASYDAVITGSKYSCVMKPGDYNTSVVANNGGVTYDRVAVVQGGNNVNEVYVEVQDVNKGVKYDLPTEVAKSASLLTLNNITPNNSTSVKGVAGSTIVVPVAGKQVVTVAGWYAGTWDINGKGSVTADSSSSATSPVTTTYVTDGTETSVTVNVTGDGANYLYWIDVQNVVDFKSELSVPGDYATLTEAVKAIKAMERPEGEAGRVTINLTADIQEQVVIDAPYVKIAGNGHTISWYYGVGTYYYSIEKATGLYNERLFRDKYSSEEGNGSLWGGVVIVQGDNFLAEDTTFKNTYNYEITDKELLDFAKTATSAFPQRTSKSVDVQTQAAKERSNALYVDANNLECFNCNILSSQDTLGANKGTDVVAYFKDCKIGGNTDFICGAGNMVFDNCELEWKSVTSDSAGNNAKLIGPTPRDGQYVFRNCNWTVDTTANGPVSGKFGRTWQQNSRSAFINTETNGLISEVGWGEMSKGQLETAQFIEYNNYSKGIPMAVTSMGNSTYDAAGTPTKMTDAEVKAIVDNLMNDDYTINTILSGWKPLHYAQKDNEFTTEATTESVTFTPMPDNGYEYVAETETKENIYKGEPIYEDVRVRIEAGQTLNVKTEGVPVTVGDRTYTKNLTSSGENSVIDINDGNGGKTYRIHNIITAKEDIKLVIDQKVGGNKTNAILKNLVDTGNKNADGISIYTAESVVAHKGGSASEFIAMEVELKAGDVVYFAGMGTNPSVYGFNVIGGTVFTDKGYDFSAENEAKTLIYKGETIYSDYRADIKAAQNLDVKEEGVPVTVGDRTYTKNLTSTGENSIIDIGDGNGGKTYRIHHQITAKEDIKLVIDQKVGGNKTNAVLKNLVSTGTNAEGTPTYTAESVVAHKGGSSSEFIAMEVEVKAGETVYFAGQGTNPAVYAYDIITPGSVEESTETTTEEVPVEKAKIFVVGDSTGCHYPDTADVTDYYKRVGFGDKIADYINADVVNLALSGRSSLSYLSDPEYQTLLSEMKAGDYLIIAFGHNDEKTEVDRFTAPSTADKPTTRDTEGSFKNSLYANYIAKAEAVGATPILCTPIVRRVEGSWSDGSLHKANGGDYAQDVRDLAAECNLTVIDNTNLTKTLYETLTPAETKYLHRWYRAQTVDNTHLNNYGAKYIAYMFAEAVKTSSSTLAPYVKANNVAPTKADLVVNPEWKEPEKADPTGDELNSKLWTTTAPWHGTVTGDIGGTNKLLECDGSGTPIEPLTLMKTGNITNFNVSENADGTVNVRSGIAKNDTTFGEVIAKDSTFGKIASTSDGLAMYYQALDSSVDFTIKGTIKLNGYQEKNNQVAYGAIVADKIFVDTYDASTIDNYVAAGPLKIADINKEIKDTATGEVTGLDVGWAGYARIAGTLTEYKDNGGLTVAPAVGDVVDVSITKKGSKYTVNYGGKISEYDVPMTGMVYAGFFASRDANITVSNIEFNNEIVE